MLYVAWLHNSTWIMMREHDAAKHTLIIWSEKKVVRILPFNIVFHKNFYCLTKLFISIMDRYFYIIQGDFFVINSDVFLLFVPCKELQRGCSREKKLTITLHGSVLHSVFGKNNSLKCRCLNSNPTFHSEKTKPWRTY